MTVINEEAGDGPAGGGSVPFALGCIIPGPFGTKTGAPSMARVASSSRARLKSLGGAESPVRRGRCSAPSPPTFTGWHTSAGQRPRSPSFSRGGNSSPGRAHATGLKPSAWPYGTTQPSCFPSRLRS